MNAYASTHTTSPDELEGEKYKSLVREGYDALSYLYRSDDATEETHPNYEVWACEIDGLLGGDGERPKGEDGIQSGRGGQILELGCGCGIPLTRTLARMGHRITGVDFSRVQIERAEQLVRGADASAEMESSAVRFICADISSRDLAHLLSGGNVERDSDDKGGDGAGPPPYDAILAFYVLIHLPLSSQPELLRRCAGWLRPGGWMMLTTGIGEWTGEQEGWLQGGDAPAGGEGAGASGGGGKGDGRGTRTPMWWSHPDLPTFKQWVRDVGLEVVREEHVPEEGCDGHQFLLLRKPDA